VERDPLDGGAGAGLFDRLVALLFLAGGLGLLAEGIRRGGLITPYDRLCLVLILGGILWFLLVWRLDAARLARLEARLGGLTHRQGEFSAWALAGVYILIMGVYVVVRHLLFNSGGFDLAIQHQIVWNTVHGRPFGSSMEVFHYFGDHVSPFLALLTPFYLIWQDPILLLLVQTVVVATCGPAAYRLAVLRTDRPWVGVAVCGFVLLLPALGFMNRYDIHSIVFATPLILWCLVWAEEGRLWPSRTMALLAISTKENAGLVVGLMALVLWRRGKWGREAWLWCAGSVGWSLIAFLVVLPHFREGFTADTLIRYAHLGSSPGEIVRNLIQDPSRVLSILFSREVRALYLILLLLPFVGRPLLRPGLLVPLLPPLAYNLLSERHSQTSIYFQYTATMLPFLIWAAVDSLSKRGMRPSGTGRTLRGVLGLLIGVTLANIVTPALFTRVGHPYADVHRWEKWMDAGAFKSVAGRIPDSASVVVTDALAPHLSKRKKLWVYRGAGWTPPADYYLVYVPNNRDLEEPEVTAADLRDRILSGRYGVVTWESEMLLLERGAEGDSAEAAEFLRHAARTWGVGDSMAPQ
jgi:uncharacterized membrane protein